MNDKAFYGIFLLAVIIAIGAIFGGYTFWLSKDTEAKIACIQAGGVYTTNTCAWSRKAEPRP